jgi:hypothetical protein
MLIPMVHRYAWVVGLALGITYAGGCSKQTVTVETANPPVTSAEGKIDPRLVGTWKTVNGASKYSFDKDGTYHLSVRKKTPGGAMTTDRSGTWSVKDSTLLVQDTKDHVVPYTIKLTGDQLSITLRADPNHNTILLRQ